jgi:ABC-type cobalamin/Fe3+-siderophores transport system ATPase subunit
MLELNNIRAGYGKRQILNGASLTVPKGKLVTVIGPNGSGKSTLFKSATGIIPTLSGEILIDGAKAADLSRSGTAKKLPIWRRASRFPI